MNAPKRTVLSGLHHRLGARMTVFSGFEMPLSYSGIIEEHLAVRSQAGIFDLSHLGELDVRGPRALELLERALTNSAARLRDGEAQYSLMCGEDGGTVDDLMVYRLGAEHYMLCVNAENVETDRAWLSALNIHGASLRDASAETALLAVQGPDSAGILAPLADFAIDAVGRLHAAAGRVAGVRCLAARTGYTGEDGFELFVAAESATALFESILDAGARAGLKPCGLGARDTLRLEAGLALYGHELDRSTSPLDAGLGMFIKFGRDFIGEAALAGQRGGGLKKQLVGLMSEDARSIARQGYRLFLNAREAGVVTSGTFAPMLNRPIAMGYLSSGEIAPRTAAPTGKLEVEIRNRKVPATIVPRPFYRRIRHAAA